MAKIRFERPAALHPHPLLARVGMMEGLATHFTLRSRKAGKNREEHRDRAEQLAGDWQALLASVTSEGVLEPLKICRIPDGDEAPRPIGTEWYIVDGRNRWMAARHAKLRRIPVIRVCPEDAPAIIAATVAARRHYTKGATAYLACLLHPEAASQGKGGDRRSERTECALKLDDLSGKFAVSPRLLDQAAELFRLLESHPAYRQDAEADVWAGAGLGGILAGIKSLIATGKRDGSEQSAEHKRAVAAWSYTTKACAQLGSAWGRWADLGQEQREQAVTRLRETLMAAPEDVKSILKTLE